MTRASPLVGGRSVARIRRVVVLPAPLGPRKPKIDPALDPEVDAGDGLDLALLAEGPPEAGGLDDVAVHVGSLSPGPSLVRRVAWRYGCCWYSAALYFSALRR